MSTRLIVLDANFDGRYVLDYSNCDGFSNFDADPPLSLAFARYFPMKFNHAFGEVLLSAQFEAVANGLTEKVDLISPIVNFEHIFDEYELLPNYCFRHGEKCIIELQASLNGWKVLRIHQNVHFLCDELPCSIVPYNASFLDQTDLPAEFTKYQQRYRQRLELSSESPISSELSFVSKSTANVDGEIVVDDSELDEPQFVNDACSQEIEHEVFKAKPMLPALKLRSKPKSPERNCLADDDDDDEDADDVARGTGGLYEAAADAAIYPDEDRMWRFPGGAIMYSTKKGVANVLLIENHCDGLCEPVNVGDVAFFNISPRRARIKDELLQRIPFTHIAFRKVQGDSDSQIELLKSNIRTFGNLLEMRIEVNLSDEKAVTPFYSDDTTSGLSESERTFYKLYTTNRLYVLIPCDRLQPFLNSRFQADFRLRAWAMRCRPIASISLQIGPSTEVFCVYKDGRVQTLPISQGVYYGISNDQPV
ncbi:unnamed protein product [Caenorhabditis bovis]|uniref:Uncharacterized protein n=1 Tax=Caenorhabditis bovis TaxID=2654633 RepID=A0A8S1F0G5_9PELO|nr:unnamed protein product [Caenorhabditis bovis]